MHQLFGVNNELGHENHIEIMFIVLTDEREYKQSNASERMQPLTNASCVYYFENKKFSSFKNSIPECVLYNIGTYNYRNTQTFRSDF